MHFRKNSKGKFYADAEISTADIEIKKRYDLFIGGQWIRPVHGKYLRCFNPTTEEILTEFAHAGPDDIDRAIKSARNAFETFWKEFPERERGKYIFRLTRLIQEQEDKLAITQSLATGKPLKESKNHDLPIAIDHFFYYAGWTDKLDYAFPQKKSEALGVCLLLLSENATFLSLAKKIAPALATGNTLVIKPTLQTSLTTLKLAELIHFAGIPPGVVNIITGNNADDLSAMQHPGIDKIVFTGSSTEWKEIRNKLAESRVKFSPQLNSKGLNIVLDDAPLDQAVDGIIEGVFLTQRSNSGVVSTLLLQESIYETFIKKFSNSLSSLVIGSPLNINTDIGPLSSKEDKQKMLNHIRMAQKLGLIVFQPEISIPAKGYYVHPTVLMDMPQGCSLRDAIIPGPVVNIQTFRSVEEAIGKANNCPYGLNAGIWSNKGSKILSLSGRLKAGIIWANAFDKMDTASPSSTLKESGIYREGGLQGLAEYLKI